MGYAYMSKRNLAKLGVPIPSKKTQETMAEVLRLWDREQTLTSEIKGRKESIMTSVLLTAAENKEG
jgi:restriction endonuclease S subunit